MKKQPFAEQVKQQQEFEQAMLIENTAMEDYKEGVRAEYREEQREIDAEYEAVRNEDF